MVNFFSCLAAKKKKDALKKETLPLVTSRAEYRAISNQERHSERYQPTACIKRETTNKIHTKKFTFDELANATQTFHPKNFLGEGAFGRVYKGKISINPDEIVAVKQLHSNGSQGSQEFLLDVLVLSALSHPNLLHLIGYCSDGNQRLLVYEYMPLGSLDRYLLDIPPDREPLSWYWRMKIALDVALGLEYLHEKADPQIIYRDLKCSKILLDEQYNAKLSDFGLTKLDPTGDNLTFSDYGYCAPEYAHTGEINTKSNIYSYGVLMLELITGRKAVDITKSPDEQLLVMWAQPMFKDKRRHKDLVDPRLQGQYPEKGLKQAVAIVNMCVQEDPKSRPTMMDVILALSHLTEPPDETYIYEQKKPTIPDKSKSKEPVHLETVPKAIDQGCSLRDEGTTKDERHTSLGVHLWGSCNIIHEMGFGIV